MSFGRSTSIFIGAALVLGCSTFSSGDSENYNAITYGDDYHRRPDGQSGWSGVAANSSAPNAEPGRAPATTEPSTSNAASEAAQSSMYDQRPVATDEGVDPTDEHVRRQIEIRRQTIGGQMDSRDRLVRSDFYDTTPYDGSLWSNENDANHFFTKGKVRSLGHIVSVKLEEPIIRQIAEEIKKSLNPAEQEVEMALYLKNSEGAKNDQDIKAYRNVAADELKTNEAGAVKEKMEKAVRWSQVDLTKAIGLAPNEEIRAEVIDRYQNGNYKIRAVKRVMYRGSSKLMSIVAVAPSADFDDKDLVTSGKLYEHRIKIAR